MKLNFLETHDRLQHLVDDQSGNVFRGAEDCFKKNPFSLAIQEKCPYVYIHAFPKTADDGVNKKMFWHPRISKPTASTNSFLFRGISGTDMLEIIWIIPERYLWAQYQQGNLLENKDVLISINNFENHRSKLELPHEDDLPEWRQQQIMASILAEHTQQIRNKNASPNVLD